MKNEKKQNHLNEMAKFLQMEIKKIMKVKDGTGTYSDEEIDILMARLVETKEFIGEWFLENHEKGIPQ
jgi:hypothetical protein